MDLPLSLSRFCGEHELEPRRPHGLEPESAQVATNIVAVPSDEIAWPVGFKTIYSRGRMGQQPHLMVLAHNQDRVVILYNYQRITVVECLSGGAYLTYLRRLGQQYAFDPFGIP